MAMNVKELCRLCGKKDDFAKDLLDESNKNILIIIQEFIQILVYENDNMPSKICLNCEEKVVSFQLYVLECYKVQESLRTMYKNENENLNIKLEQQCLEPTTTSLVKSEDYEVKNEMTAEDIVSALRNEGGLQNIQMYEPENYENDDSHHNDDGDDDYWDNVAIASLKEIKNKQIKKKVESKKDTNVLNDILKLPSFKVKDLVKFECIICDEKVKTFSSLSQHCASNHQSEPVMICMCGFVIKSKSILYKHVSDHKLESETMRKSSESEDKNNDKLPYSNLNVKDFVKFVCNECSLEYSSWYRLRSHCEYKHKTQPQVQCICGVTLKSKSVMYKHIQNHKNPDFFACDKCPKIAKTLEALNKHKMRHVPKSERGSSCPSCNKKFKSLEALKSHVRSHIPIEARKIYHCEVCNLKFTTRSSAASHKRVVHDKIKGYVCDLCGYACGTNGELRQHSAIHSDDKPYVCNKCSKRFKTYSNLKTHMDIHEDTSYQCLICRRVLNSRRTLRKHLLVHEDKCRHICPYCNKAFKRQQTLKVHMYTHTGDKPLTCKWCEERFAYASTLRSHRLRCHPDKMAAQGHGNYHSFTHNIEQDYIKNTAAVSSQIAKNEGEAM